MPNISGIIKSLQNIMWKDPGVSGDAQRLEQLGWMITLKILDDKDEEMKLLNEDYVSVTFSRDFGTLNDFYEIGGELMPGATVQQMSEDEMIVRVKLPELKTYSSLDEHDQTSVMRDIATVFQQVHIKADIQGVTDTVVNGNKTENVYITEVAAASKLIPAEFMQAFNGFGGVYMTSVVWRANTRTWNYEVIIYSK